MLRISKLADYGTLVMVYLAMHDDRLCAATEISKKTHLGLPTVSKLLKLLTNAGFLTSQRGPKGGYQLRKPATEITVAQIISALEERTGLTQCSHESELCVLHEVCNLKGNWRMISHAIETALDSISLAVLARPGMNQRQVNTKNLLKIAQELE